MKIRKIEVFPIRLPYKKPIADFRNTITHKATVLVRVELDDGVFGWGEAAAYGDVSDEVASLIQKKLAPHVLGKDVTPRQAHAVLKKETAHFGQRGLVIMAISGLDIALWDALAHQSDLPLCQLLGGAMKKPRKVRLYAGTGYYTAKGHSKINDLRYLKDSLENKALLGGTKIKIGRRGISDDIDRIRLAREVLPKGHRLMVDANNAYGPAEALSLARRAEKYNLSFFEEPLEFELFRLPKISAKLRTQSPIPIAGYEKEMTLQGFFPHIQEKSVDFLQPDCIWSGGITECLNIAAEVEMANVKKHKIAVLPHNFASPISTAANYHFICAINSASGDLEIDSTGSPLDNIFFSSDTREMRELQEGTLLIKGIGLGMAPDISYLRKNFRSSCAKA